MYVCVYIYIYIYIYINTCISCIEWGPQATSGSIAFCSRLFACSNPHVDWCSDPFPWDPLRKTQFGIQK